MLVIIDRFEGAYAICESEDREIIRIKRDNIPGEAKEGDVLRMEGECIKIDMEQTNKRQQEIENSAKNLWR